MDRLFCSIIDYVKESSLKLGKLDSSASFNFPPDTLKSLLGDRGMSNDDLLFSLKQATNNFPYGGLSFERRQDVYVLTIEKDAVTRIESLPKTRKDEFLSRLIAFTTKPFAGRNEVRELFQAYGDFTVLTGQEGEFDEVFFFSSFDDFCYCLTYEALGIHYHRLLKDDFQSLYPNYNKN